MKKEFDIEKEVGKKMPYNIPDAFFDKLEDNIMTQLKEEEQQRQRPVVMRVVRNNWKSIISLSVAACAAVLLVVRHNIPEKEAQQPYEFNNVELAYSNLSTEDQQFLIEMYSDSEDEYLINYEEN